MIISASVINELTGISENTFNDLKLIISDLQNSRFSFIYNYVREFVNLENFLKPEDIKAYVSTVQ